MIPNAAATRLRNGRTPARRALRVVSATETAVPIARLQPGTKVGLALPAWRWDGEGSYDDGYLIGHFIGDGHFAGNLVHLDVWDGPGVEPVKALLLSIAQRFPHRANWMGFRRIPGHNKDQLGSSALLGFMTEWQLFPGAKTLNDRMESASSDFIRGVISGLLDTDGHVEGKPEKGVTIRLSQSDRDLLGRCQRLMAWLGIRATINAAREAGSRMMPDGQGGLRAYATKANWRLIVGSSDARRLADVAGFVDTSKASKFDNLTAGMTTYRKKPEDRVASVEHYRTDLVEVHIVSGSRWLAINGIAVDGCAEHEKILPGAPAQTHRWTGSIGDSNTLMREAMALRRAGRKVNEIALQVRSTPARVREALELAGMPERPPRERIAEKLPQLELAQAYQRGFGLSELATYYGVSEAPIREVLAAQGVTLRGRGRLGRTEAIWSLSREELAAEYATAGMVELAGRYGVAAGTVKNVLNHHGIPLRPTGRRARKSPI
ncbi:LAGLIDADG family homing endonuclease [Micromonospora sp. NPDC048905]|uniref:LAGLIDADG family homing endonuclease n=1 Tax=Micromonospora sp. NPDC048905 TaxID=3155494 RepID=UPI0033C84E4F